MRKKIFFAFLICLLFLVGCAQTPAKVDLASYIRPGYFGTNSHGTAVLDFDYAAFERDVEEILGEQVGEEVVLKLENAFTLTAEPAEDLSNGDTVQIRAQIDRSALEGIGLEVTCSEISDLVQGLSTGETLDPFDNIEVHFDGASPNVTMSIDVLSVEGAYGWLSYVTDQNTGLAIGDTVTVRVEYDPAVLGRMGVSLSADSMEYTVPDYLAVCPDDWAAFSDEMRADLAEDIKLQIASLRYREEGVDVYSGGTRVTGTPALDCRDFAYVSASFLTLKEGESYDEENMDFCNALLVCYCFNAKSEGDPGDPSTLYGGFLIPDLAISSSDFVQQSAEYIFTSADLDREAWYQREIAPLGEYYDITAVEFAPAEVAGEAAAVSDENA